MKRGKLFVLLGMVVALLLVVAAGFVMFSGLSQAAGTRSERDTLRDELKGYYQKKPFPNKKNVALEAKNLEIVKTAYEQLLAGLQASNVPTNETNPINFNSRRESMTAELIAKSPVGEGGARVVPSDFTFGFARYKEGNLARKDDVPRLTRQLRMVELLVREIYAAGVLRLVSISREEFELASTEAPVETSGRHRPGRGQPEASPSDSVPVGGRVEGPVPMDRQIFSIELVANENSIIELLNRVAKMSMFVVVTRLDISKTGPDYVLAPSETAEVAASAVGGMTTPEAAPDVKLPPPTKTARLVSGRDREATVKVQMEVQVFSFEGEV